MKRGRYQFRITVIKLFLLCLTFSTVAYGQSAITKTALNKSRKATIEIESLLKEAYGMEKRGNCASAILIANKALEKIETKESKHSDSIYTMRAYTTKAHCYSNMGNNTEALKLYKTAVNYAEHLNTKAELADLYNNIFSVYYRERNFVNGEDLLKSALAICITLKDSARIRNIYNNAALLEYEQGNYRNALKKMDKAFEYIAANDKIAQSLILTNKAEVLFKMNNLNDSEATLEQAIRLQHGQITERTLQTILNITLVKAFLGKKQEVRSLLKSIKKNMGTFSLPTKENAYKELSEINFAIGDSLNGYSDMKAGIELSDSLQTIDNKSELQQLIIAYDTERLKKHNELLQQQVKTRNAITIASLIVFVIIATFSVITIRRMKIDRQKNILIAKQRERLLEMEKIEHERNEREMTLKIDHKNRQLTTYTIDLSAINAFHKKLSKTLEDIEKTIHSCKQNKPDDATKQAVSMDETSVMTTAKGKDSKEDKAIDEASKRIKEVVAELSHYDNKAVDNDFRVYFEEVHPGYLKKLSHAFPHLSDTDLRMCAYLYLGMSTKEIAALTFREVRSIESSRNRLRKKLNLPAEANLKEFLNAEEWRFNSLS